MQLNKEKDSDWFTVSSNKEGTEWKGKVWYVHNLLKYEFDLEFEIPATYPATAPELALPELDGKTAKMYRGGKIRPQPSARRPTCCGASAGSSWCRGSGPRRW